MRVRYFDEFILERLFDTPEGYISTRLDSIERTIRSLFDTQESDESVDTFSAKEQKEKKEGGKMKFSELGIQLDSIQKSKYSKIQDNIKCRFSDDENLYDFTVILDLKDAVPADGSKDFSSDDIKDCFVKFKKYNIDSFDLLGEISKNIKIDDIDEDLLIELKLELDGGSKGESDENFSIETE